MTGLLPAVLLGAGVAVLLSRPSSSARLRSLVPRSAPSRVQRAVGPGAACVLAGVAVALLVGGPPGWVLGGLLSCSARACWRAWSLAPTGVPGSKLAAELPLALDLLAACLSGGAPLAGAVSAVATALPGPCGDRFARVSAALAVGSPPAEAWVALSGGGSTAPTAVTARAVGRGTGRPSPHLPTSTAHRTSADDRTSVDHRTAAAHRTSAADPVAGAAARALARAAEGGAPVAAAVARVAADARDEAGARGAAAARRAGVLAVAPLGLCFLPAFVLLGVVPAVVGLAAPVLGQL